MPVYKFTDGRKGYYFQFYFNKKKIKKERWNGRHMDSKVEAQQAEFECKKQLEKDFGIRDDITLLALFDEFCKTAKGNLKDSTLYRTYESFRKIYLPMIENKKIRKLNPNDFLNWKNEIKELSISVERKNRLINIMKSCLNYGVTMYNLPGNLQYALMEKIKEHNVIAIENEKEEYIPSQDFEKLCQPLLDYQTKENNFFYYYTILNILYYTGIRIGELAAITVEDFKDNYLIINKNYMRIKNKDYIQSPKNANSIRKVTLDTQTSNLLSKYIEIYKPKNIVFKLKGNYLNQQKLRRIMRQLGEDTELGEIYDLHPHSLRHSHASNLRKLGYDEFVISRRLGNTPKVSATTYIHSEFSEQLELAKKLR